MTIKREQRAKEKNGERRPAVLLELPDRMLAVARESILYAEIMKNDCKLVTYEACGEREYTLLRFPLKDLIEQVDDPYFIRCHKSYAVNVRQIRSIEKMDYRSGNIFFYTSDRVIIYSEKYKRDLEQLLQALHQVMLCHVSLLIWLIFLIIIAASKDQGKSHGNCGKRIPMFLFFLVC